MPTPLIDNVNPLVASETFDGKTITFVFACPASGRQVTATHAVQATAGARPELQSKVKKAALSSLRGPLSSAIRGAFGQGTVGKMLGNIASKSAATVLSESAKAKPAPALAAGERDAAALAAFASIAGQFEWDTSRASWVSSAVASELLSGFQRQVGGAPIDSPYDREVSARMLVEVASADGERQEEELELLALFLDASRDSIEDLAARPDLTPAELAEVTPGEVRTSMLAIAWLVALANEGCDSVEEALLDRFARDLQLTSEQAFHARTLAGEFLVEQTLTRELATGDPLQARAAVRALARTIGMDPGTLERVEARYHKRRAASTR